MKQILLFAIIIGFASCEQTDCYVCKRDYYNAAGNITKTDTVETRCNVTQSEYNSLANKYPQWKPTSGEEGWHYHCDKKEK